MADGPGRYNYARDNPVRLTDPDGRQSGDDPDDPTKSPDPPEAGGGDDRKPVPRQQRLEWKDKGKEEFDRAAISADVLKYVEGLGPDDLPAKARESIIRFWRQSFQHHQTMAFEYMVRVLATRDAPEPPPAPEERAVEYQLQSMFVHNNSPAGLPSFGSWDTTFSVVWKDAAALHDSTLHKWLNWVPESESFEYSFGHEPSAGGTLSIHHLDPGDPENQFGLTDHLQLSGAIDVFDITWKPRIGGKPRDLLEGKLTLAGQYDFYTKQFQLQLQPGLELHITQDTFSAVFQYQDPATIGKWLPPRLHGQPTSWGVGLLWKF